MSAFRLLGSTNPLTGVTIRGILTTAAAVLAGTLVAVFAAGGTYALWNDTQETPDASVTSGTVGLTVSAIPDLRLELLVPGASVHTAFTVSNTGNADLTVSASQTLAGQTNGLASHLEYSLARVANAGDCTTALLGATPAPIRIDSAQSAVYCLVVKLREDAPVGAQGGTADFALTFDGVQVAP